MKKLIFFALIISVLLFSGCGESKKTEEVTTKTTEIQPPKQETWWESQCKDECKEDIGCFNKCMNKKAVIAQKPELCEFITSDSFKERCKDNVLVRKAITSGDIKFCEQITDENIKQSCENKLS